MKTFGPRARHVLVGALVVCLAVDAYVHLHLASRYQLAAPGGIGGGNLFRIEAGVAILIGLAVLARPGRATLA
ncbi:MAG: hypothetical protein ABI131_11100, partial [Nostocoides sp.]